MRNQNWSITLTPSDEPGDGQIRLTGEWNGRLLRCRTHRHYIMAEITVARGDVAGLASALRALQLIGRPLEPKVTMEEFEALTASILPHLESVVEDIEIQHVQKALEDPLAWYAHQSANRELAKAGFPVEQEEPRKLSPAERKRAEEIAKDSPEMARAIEEYDQIDQIRREFEADPAAFREKYEVKPK